MDRNMLSVMAGECLNKRQRYALSLNRTLNRVVLSRGLQCDL